MCKRVLPRQFQAIGVFLIVACLSFLTWFMLSADFRQALFAVPQTLAVVEETIGLPTNTAEDVFTDHEYSGYVTITIAGEGRIDNETRHNAFYQFNADGTSRFQGFTVDGEGPLLRSFAVVPTPTDRTNNEYYFLYYVGEISRKLGFRMVNDNASDTSVFTVQVTTRNLVSAWGR